MMLISYVSGDIYLHNPRGNNNRCDRRTNDRRNANRLFDSQNNAAGGYAAPCDRPEDAETPEDIQCFQMNYYEESYLPIRWTSQHSCGENNNCQYIIQYSCDNTLGEGVRDGHPQNSHGDTCTNTIPELEETELENPLRYGRHETYHYYQKCKSTNRNMGLFTADQNLRGNSAIYTRQNPNGQRYGFECPEERDYYPYWRHSPWIDIAVLIENNDVGICEEYMNNSQCFVPKHECYDINDNRLADIDYDECISREGVWIEHPSWNMVDDVPNCNMTCGHAPSSIINRLGIANTSNLHQEYMWKLPKVSETLNNCVLRIRYNITTNDTPRNLTYSNNSIIRNNPVVNISDVPLRLAVDTSQFGRTFEDRTWTFNILKRPEILEDKNIYNFNVQGKRGNIAQVRNCIEYDYVPNRLNLTTEDYIHFQWVGSDFNPQNNDGEGRAGTDRSNIVELHNFKNAIPEDTNTMFDDEETRYVFASLGQSINDPEVCFTYEELRNRRNDENNIKNCALLNSASPYFNYFPFKINKTGQYKLINTRNNNFSNRGQKAKINIYSEETEDTEENEVLESSTGIAYDDPNVIAIILSSFVVVIIMVSAAIYYRNEERWENLKKSINNIRNSCKRQI